MTPIHRLVGTVMILWLLTIISCIVPLRWALFAVPRRFWAGVILSCAALIGGYLGTTHFRVMASKTVNGQVTWKFDSRIFFIVTLVLAALTLAFTVWRGKASRRPSASA